MDDGGLSWDDDRAMTESSFSIIVAVTIAVLLPLIIMGLSAVLGPKKSAPHKLDPYESGVSIPVGTARERFSIKFYLVAILFIVFDVEAVFLFPWAVNFRELGMFGLVEMFVFITVLFAGFVYIVKKGALKWD
jgi:NADH-quinone oxidoreductase subunit A